MKNSLLFLLFFFLSVVFFGCQTSTTHYLGARVDDGESFSLPITQVEDQQWQDIYVTVDYKMNRSGEHLDIEGILSFSHSSKVNYTRVRDLKLKLFLLDRDKRVVSYQDIARTLSQNLDDKTAFTKTLQLHEDIVSFAFGYEGSFMDDEPRIPSTDRVWKLPKRQ